jgi:hypothetical protein
MDPDITLNEILAVARQESEQLIQFYVGVEHLFMALTRIRGGVTAELLEARGVLGFFLAAIARDSYQRADDQSYWPDFRITERAQKVLDLTHENMAKGGLPADRALLLAILNEGDSLPLRILQELGTDLASLTAAAQSWDSRTPIAMPLVPIQVEDPNVRLEPAHERLIRLMFRGVDKIFIKKALTDGFGGSIVLLVQVRQTILNAPVVIKLDDRQAIQYEKLRYDQWIKGILPPNTSSIVDDPTLLPDENLAGIKYTFVSRPGEIAARNARQYSVENGGLKLAAFIRDALFKTFAPYWWGQGNVVRFQAWQEYELLLPPALVIEVITPEEITSPIRTLYPFGVWSRTNTIHVGEPVVLENFVAQKSKPEKNLIQLSSGAGSEAGARSGRIDVRGLDKLGAQIPRGQTVRYVVGRVIQTRSDILAEQVQSLEPDFDISAEYFASPLGGGFPNPIPLIPRLLDRWFDGSISPIHGDLHTGNILVGPAGDAWLIDFEWTRQGHSLFDWAVLETSLLIDLVAAEVAPGWASAWHVIQVLQEIGETNTIPAWVDPKLQALFNPILEVRSIVRTLLAPGALWSEYWMALAMTSLRVLAWPTRPLVARRMMYLAAALHMKSLRLAENDFMLGDSLTRTSVDIRKTSKKPE